MKLADQTVILVLHFLGTTLLFSIKAAPFYIPTKDSSFSYALTLFFCLIGNFFCTLRT